MSNLIKSVYFNVDPTQIRTIDSDEKVKKYIPNIYDKPDEPEEFAFPSFDAPAPENADMEAQEFEDGLSVISMDDVIGEERQKLSEQMSQEKEEVLEQARQEADSILAEAQEQAEAIKEMARTEGHAKGLEEGRAQAGLELDQMRQSLQDEYEGRFQELDEQEKNLEPAFADIIVSLVRKLTGVVCEDKKDVILYLIGSAIRNMEKSSRIVLRVSKKDISRVSAKKATLRAIAKDVSEFDIVEDDSLTENQCIIETDNKIIDCSLDAQLKNLEEHVKLLVY